MSSAEHFRVLAPSGSKASGEHIGFSTLPDQLVNRELQRGFYFNILCIGETGVGKSTLIDSLFKSNFEDPEIDHKDVDVQVQSRTHFLEDGGVSLQVMVVSSVNFGDKLDRRSAIDPLKAYCDAQYETYLQEELKTVRDLVNFHDTRIHVCLYFFTPTGTKVKPSDIACLKKIHKLVNVVPVIAKADTITKEELVRFKEVLLEEFDKNEIEIYHPDEEGIEAEYEQYIPFSVIGSREEIVVNGEKLRVRQYPWGLVEVENEQHSDFVHLREMLLRTHLESLRSRTHNVLYARYRRHKLAEMGYTDTDDQGNPVSLRDLYEQKRRQHQQELSRKEDAMRQSFVMRVKKKEAELKAAEQTLAAKFEKLQQIHLDEQRKIQANMQALDEERTTFFEQVHAEAEALMQAQAASSGKDKKKKDKKDKKSKD